MTSVISNASRAMAPVQPFMITRWSLPLSVAAHGAILLAVAWLVVPRSLEQPRMRVIAVEIISQAMAPPPTLPAPVAPVLSSPIAPAAPVSPPEPQDGMVRATDFYAASILADPANAEVRVNFPLLASSEQVVQLCNMEALEQLHLARTDLAPDALVGYAFADLSVQGNTLAADGGAFRSRGGWFHLRYRCAVSPDVSAVVAFEYAIGDPVPESQWEEHFLNSDDDWLD
ncbi:hypothetical protein GCM10007913_41530 [Devosia yakushimensis]|uniref:DUF930 domain-containing protein n=1 Tax=Devosia yakushimensis TaxID=470028 RepID=A0ABQ5UM12_9HYPH|nr:DUF930 domain-containing protein [Devosia yakushimensis]GLQ12220.1 hypothetical protein GCM10007913_41530 [Devosia yakushimensis]